MNKGRSRRLTLIRHAESEWNALGLVQGHALCGLTPLGRQQALKLASWVATGPPIAHLFSSDLPRCMETAEIISAAVGVAVSSDSRLREVDAGQWTGESWSRLLSQGDERVQAFTANPQVTKIPGGESMGDVRARVIPALRELLDETSVGDLAAVTHGGPITEVLTWIGYNHLSEPVKNASAVVLIVESDLHDARVELWNPAQGPAGTLNGDGLPR